MAVEYRNTLKNAKNIIAESYVRRGSSAMYAAKSESSSAPEDHVPLLDDEAKLFELRVL